MTAGKASASDASDKEAQDEGCRVGAVDAVSGDVVSCSSQTLDCFESTLDQPGKPPGRPRALRSAFRGGG